MTFVTRNVGVIDSIIRTLISIGLIYVGYFNDSIIIDPFSRNIISLIGVLSLIIVTIGICPLYSLAGINTCANKDK